jgi:hypothetical protein
MTGTMGKRTTVFARCQQRGCSHVAQGSRRATLEPHSPLWAKRVTFVKTQTASTTAAHDDQGRSSRGKLNGNHHPFPVQKATEEVAYPLQPAIFLPE